MIEATKEKAGVSSDVQLDGLVSKGFQVSSTTAYRRAEVYSAVNVRPSRSWRLVAGPLLKWLRRRVFQRKVLGGPTRALPGLNQVLRHSV